MTDYQVSITRARLLRHAPTSRQARRGTDVRLRGPMGKTGARDLCVAKFACSRDSLGWRGPGGSCRSRRTRARPDRLAAMTASAAAYPDPGTGVPFGDATPAQVRAALAPEDVPAFDAQWQETMARATRTLDLAEVLDTLTAWRRTARVTASLGIDGYRRMVMAAAQTLATGTLPPGTSPVADVRARLAARLARTTEGHDGHDAGTALGAGPGGRSDRE